MRNFWKFLMMMCLPCLSFAEEGGGGDAGASGGEGGGAAGGDAGSGAGESGGEAGAGASEGGEGGSAGGAGEQGGSGGEGGGDGGEQGTPDYSTPEGFAAFAREHGAFDSADKYNIPITFDDVQIPEHLSSVWDVKGDASAFAEMAAKHSLTQAQAEGVFKDYMKTALAMSEKGEAEALEAQKPEVIMKEVYGDKAAEAMPALDRGLKALNIDASKGLRVHHAMKAIAELGRLVGEDGNFHGAGAGGAQNEELSAEEWLAKAANGSR